MADRLEADVVIVGAGVAGSLIAWTLAQAGAKVLVLESGPWVDRAKAVETYRAAVAKVPEAPYPDLEYAPRPTVIALDAYYEQQGPDNFQSTYERRVGGTTWHWQGTAMRHLPNDFQINSLYGVGVDWPITYDQLEPWYVRAEQALGVAGDTDMSSPRSAPYVMPAVPPSYLDLHINDALQPLGMQVLTTPQAKNSQAFDGRPPCCGNNLCVPICPIGAKYDGAVHARKAQDAGAQIEADAVVHRIEVDSDGRVTRVLFKRPDGSEHEAAGQVFVVAAHAIETPKLLLMSRTDALPNGIANSSDMVGRNLMDHVTQLSLCLARDPIWPYRAPVETSGIEHLRDGEHRREWAAFRTPIGNDGWSFGGENPVALAASLVADEGLRGAALRDRIQQTAERQVRLAALVEQLPNPDNRVTLSEDKQDVLGNPYPRIQYQVDDYSKRGMEQARGLADQVFDAISATYRMHQPVFFGAGHIVGTYRMGTDPASSVVNPQGRSHDHPNLYLAGSGLFPTEATANPTLTLCALALWCADTIKGNLAQ